VLNGNSFSTPQNSLTVSSSSSTLKKHDTMLFTTVCILLPPATCAKFAGVIYSAYLSQSYLAWPIPVVARSKRRGSAAVRLLRLRVRIPAVAWTSVSCECFLL
jgi:hypothetical protein